MYLIKFTTNSNQEFINQTFDTVENTKNQKEVINKSQQIENFTANVLGDFGYNLFKDGVVDKNLIEKAQKDNDNKLIEFTSGKAFFTTTKDEEEIKSIFETLYNKELDNANKIGSKSMISFNYAYEKVKEEDINKKNYLELTEEINKKNLGFSFVNENFDKLFKDRNNISFEYKKELDIENIKREYSPNVEEVDNDQEIEKLKEKLKEKEQALKETTKKKDKKDLNRQINNFNKKIEELKKPNNKLSETKNTNLSNNIEDIVKVEKKIGDTKRNSYSETKDSIIYNKMFVLKADLNNVGANFSKLKNQKLEVYQEISREFFDKIRSEKINKRLNERKSKCLFAAGDDILLLVNVGELKIVIELLDKLVDEINNKFDKVEDFTKITYAAGLSIVDYRLPIRLYYQEVEDYLSKAKSDKSENKIYFGEEIYSSNELKETFEMANEIQIRENNFKSNSNFYNNLVYRLKNSSLIRPTILLANSIINENIDINIKNKNTFIDYVSKVENKNKKLVNLINLALYLSYVNSGKDEQKDFLNEDKLIDLIKEEVKDIIDIDEIDLGNSVGMYLELYEKANNNQLDKESIFNVVFRKDNKTFMLEQNKLKKLVQNLLEDKKTRKELSKEKQINLLLAKIVLLKIENPKGE